MSEELGGSEILQVLVVSDDQDSVCCTFEVCAPSTDSVENREKLLVVDVVVQLGMVHGSQVKGDRVNLVVLVNLGEDCSDHVI
jgi:hypothetical protein